MSDNEVASNKTISPNPLTYAELNLHQHHPTNKLHHPDENFSELDEKLHMADKYLYPYATAEDDIITHKPPMSPTPYMLSAPSRILNSSLSHHSQTSNQDNYGNSFDRYGSLKRGKDLHINNHDNFIGWNLDR